MNAEVYKCVSNWTSAYQHLALERKRFSEVANGCYNMLKPIINAIPDYEATSIIKNASGVDIEKLEAWARGNKSIPPTEEELIAIMNINQSIETLQQIASMY